ncbi:unnamed protein product [Meganyctiphanes norvegica]|uniref:Uncharacterized protein n=1 Tax=Meganyctiphanes norvegica TaxID=48144 RepID=A0AAV2R033_MEGNR
MEPGSLGTAETTITEARIWLRQIPALHATQMVNLHVHKSNSLIITNNTFVGYHSLQNLEFTDLAIIESVEFGTFSTMPNLQSLVAYGCVIYELGPGSLYFNPGSIKQISLHAIDKIYPGAIAGIPKGVELHITQLHSSDLSIEIFGGLLYGGAKLRVEAPLHSCACQAAWIVRDNSSMALNDAGAVSVMCFDFQVPNPNGYTGPPYLSSLSADDFSDCP